MTPPRELFKLTAEERQSLLWRRLKTHLDEELFLCRVKNDSPHSADETATIRGEINMIKRILSVGEVSPLGI